jgi:4-amino-4-deoxy-L-arabinose transferase-like glycosyltransferase
MPSERSTLAGLVITVALIMAAALWEYFTTLALIACASWLVAAVGLPRSSMPERLMGMGWGRLTLLLLLVALLLRWMLLFQNSPGVTLGGAEELAMRGDLLVEGKVPYEDFPVRKPPMYLFLGGGIASLFGKSVLGVRLVLGFFDALVVLVLAQVGSERFSPRAGVSAGLLYALFPVGVFSVGLAGHYDGVVVLCVLAGLLLHGRGRWWEAMALLGLGFAFKLYPVVLVPWLIWREEGWRRRVGGAVTFLVPMALSWVPILLWNPAALSQYASWQSTWFPVKSISYGIMQLAGWARDSDPAIIAGQAVTVAFLLLLVVMFLDWVRRRERDPDGHARDWFRVVAVSYFVLYAMIIAGSVVEYELAPEGVSPRAMGAVIAAVCLALGAVPLWYLLRRFMEPWPSLGEGERLYLVMGLSVMLLLLSSTQNNPWYLVWMVSLVLLVQEDRIRTAILALSIWNVEDSGITLWPSRNLSGGPPT